MSPDGRWVVVCQARDGGPERPYYIEGRGPGEPLDGYLTSDPTGRYLAVTAHGRLYVRDTVNHTQVDFTARGADTRSAGEDYDFPGYRAVSIDADGHVLYFRRRGLGCAAVVHTMGNGRDSEIVYSDSLLRGSLIQGWVILRQLPPALPVDEYSEDVGCYPMGDVGKHKPNRLSSGDAAVVAPISGVWERSIDSLVTVWKKNLYYYQDDALWIERLPQGDDQGGGDASEPNRRELLPASCSPVVLAHPNEDEALVVACKRGEPGRAIVHVWPPSAPPFDLEVPLKALANLTWSSDQLALEGNAGDTAIGERIDRRIRDLDGRYLVVGWGHNAVTQNANQDIELVDFARRSGVKIGMGDAFGALVAGRFVALDPYLIDLERAETIAKYTGKSHAILPDGTMLMSDATPQDTTFSMHLKRLEVCGPLHFRSLR